MTKILVPNRSECAGVFHICSTADFAHHRSLCGDDLNPHHWNIRESSDYVLSSVPLCLDCLEVLDDD